MSAMPETAEALKAKLKALPNKPGVYMMRQSDGEVIYVGKAVNLRSRVRSYFHKSTTYSHKMRRLLERTAEVEWVVTKSELEALLLEMNLIKEHRPRFNVLMKDDKRYPYIKVEWDSPFPKVYPTRQVREDGGRYFGPYASAHSMRDTLNTLRKVFPFLTCDRQITGRDARACLYYDIGLCMAPCIGAVNPAQYRSMIVQLCRFLEGQSEPVLDELRAEMMDAADSLDYERAARLRDRIQAIERVIERQQIISPELADKDVLALARDDGSAVAQVFFVRNGKLMGREYFLLEGSEGEDDEELVASFIKQFYDSTQVPGEVIVPRYPEEARIIERWLEDRRGTRVVISLPHEERDHSLLELATENAAETLRALRSHWATEAGGSVALAELQDTLGLPAVPERIECFDVSNLQGSNPTASMVVFKAGSPARSEYRRFRIRSAATPDDYAMLREVLQRRCVRLAEARQAPGNAPASRGHGWGAAPDLLLVDGGKGQLAVAQAVVQSLGLDDIPLAALAKRQEELFVVGRGEPIVLPRNSQALFLVQRLRDEAHRFALGYHTKLRAREGLQSSLDAVPGIGRKRRQALLSHFGSLDAIRRASLDELASVSGMTRSAAQNVRAHLESV